MSVMAVCRHWFLDLSFLMDIQLWKKWLVGVLMFNVGSYAIADKPNPVSHLEIVSLKRINQFGRDDDGCTKWKMSKNQILQAFSKMERVESSFWGMVCQAYSCAYEGKAKYAGQLYSIEVNAAATIILYGEGKETLYFVDKKPRSYFLADCGSNERTSQVPRPARPNTDRVRP